MDLEVILPPSAETISPVFVTAPASHCGGAMIQRALCSGSNSICFGDNLFDEILSLVDWSVGLIERHKEQQEWEVSRLELALNRTPTTWMPELAPPFDLYIASLLSVIYNVPFTAQDYAKSLDRDVWAVARTGVPGTRVSDLAAIFPKSKFIYVHRNPVDFVQDALRDKPDSNVRDLCDDWNTSMREYLTHSSDRMLKVSYENAVENPTEFAQSLEDFCGATGINPSLVAVPSEAESASQYKMGEDMTAVVKSACEDMLAVYYPMLA